MSSPHLLRRRVVVALVALLVGVLVLGTTIAVIVVRRPIPGHSGEVRTAVESEVRIERDDRGVPQIYATSDRDLFFAQGYVHAQDRFFEMDYRRHVTAGRVSELVGENEIALGADIFIRTLGWRDVAEEEWGLLSRESQEFFEAYAEGVNAYIGTREASELAMEYTILGLQVQVENPEPWTPIDSLAWLKAMAWDLNSGWHDELRRATAYRAIGDVERVEELLPSYPYDRHAPIIPGPNSPVDVADTSGPVTSDELEAALASDAIPQALAVLDAVPTLIGEGEGVGSNSFVVAGEHTASGKPLLANDPHLGLGIPGVWYQVGLRCIEVNAACTFDAGGFSFSGMPGLLIGHNADVAWGLTNLGSDVSDFFLERVYSDGTYEYDGERVPLETRTEVIEVNGGEPVTIEVRSTGHGPLITAADAVTATPVPPGSPSGGLDGYQVSVQWTALEPSGTANAIFGINRATNVEELQSALEHFAAPAQSVVFSTADRDIGYQVPGLMPIRNDVPGPVPSDGTWPRPGWDPAYDWQGYVPARDLPGVVNPDEGFIVTANNAVTVPGDGPFLGDDFDAGFRSTRIRALLNGAIENGEDISVEVANELMLDSAHPIADAFVPRILRLDLDDGFLSEAVTLLRDWREAGYPNDAESPGAAYFNAVWANLVRHTFMDELPEDVGVNGGNRWMDVMVRLMDDPQNPWWDDISTAAVTETRDEILLQSLTDARAQLTNILGKDADRWQWGDLHQAEFHHPVLSPDAVPAAISWILNPAPFPVSGGSASVNATNWDVTFEEDGRPAFTVASGPSMRMVVDMANLDTATWVTSTGNLGHPTSRHYMDQIAAWRDGSTFPWPWSEDAVAGATRNTLTLAPRE